MAEYIEREAAVKAFNNFDAGRADSPPFTLLTPEEFAEYLYELPAADVAPVVRCKNCKYFNHEHMECENEVVSTDHEGGAQYSLKFWLNDFCSYGERKETE